MIRTDVLIVGSEGAGARAAIAASETGADVLVASKGRVGRSGATVTAVAGIAVGGQGIRETLMLPGDPADTPELFFEDIVNEGKQINNRRLVELIVNEGPQRVRELVEWGMRVHPSDARIPGHRVPRCVHTTGRQIVGALKRRLRRCSGVRILEDTMITDLLTVDGRVVGAVGLDLCEGEPLAISAKAVILATGGGQMLYPVQTAPEELTGDGLAMAYRAGAELVDMEMIQFLPCNFITPPAWKGLGFPFTIGPGGGLRNTWLLNKWGERFMARWDPQRMENATRDLLSVAIMEEVMAGRGSPHGGVYLSLAHLPGNLIDDFGRWFRLVQPDWHYGGFHFGELVEEIKKGFAMEVAPACHFFMGGVRIDEHCATNVEALFAVGEVAGGGHGANRLSDVALTEVFVHGAIGGRQAASYATKAERVPPDDRQVEEQQQALLRPLQRRGGQDAVQLKRRIQNLAWENAGVIRTGTALAAAAQEAVGIRRHELPELCCRAKNRRYNREWIEALQCGNLLAVLECAARAALAREESRGAHYRKDHPEMSREGALRNIVVSRRDPEMTVSSLPVVSSSNSSEKGLR